MKAIVPSGKKVGTYIGRVAVRSSGSFNISTPSQLIQGIGADIAKLFAAWMGILTRSNNVNPS